MAYINQRFPDCISFGAVFAPTYSTTKVEVESGFTYRNQAWSNSLLVADVSFAAQEQPLSDLLVDHFHVANGRTHKFRCKDWTDFKVIAGEGVFLLIDATHFQMQKLYTSGSGTQRRKISRPNSGTVTITGGTVLSIDYETGIITMTSGTPTAWTGYFDVPCSYDTDRLPGEIVNRRGAGGELIMAYNSIPLVEVRE